MTGRFYMATAQRRISVLNLLDSRWSQRLSWERPDMDTAVGKSQVRVAVAGVGYWGKNLVRNFSDLGALEALCDADPAAQSLCNAKYNCVRFVSDYAKLLADPAVTAIALATPAVTHYEMAKAALEAGKDVLVEKPLAIDVKHGEELVKIAAAKGRILMVGHILRYHPATLKLKQLIKDGVLGKIN